MVKEPAGCGAFPRAQRRALELRGSKVLLVRSTAEGLAVRLSALLHVSAGLPGTDRGTVWEQEVELVLRDGRATETPPEGTLWITEGFVHTPAGRRSQLASEGELRGPVRLELRGDEGALTAAGGDLDIVPRGDPRFLDRFEGAA